MTDVVLAAVIGTIGTVTAPVFTLLIKATIDNPGTLVIHKSRRDALKGTWIGRTDQERGPDGNPLSVTIVTSFTPNRRFISMTGTVEYNNRTMRMRAKGFLISDNYLRVEYTSVEREVQNFGVMFLQLSADAKRLRGRMVGYGSASEAIVSGATQLEKQVP
jgi:hypothetical protein